MSKARVSVRLPLLASVALLSAPAFAGPPEDAPVAGASERVVFDCLVNGRSLRFDIAGDQLADGSGTVTMLADGVYAISQAGQTYLIDETGLQIDSGPDAGKWDCQRGTVTPAGGATGSGEGYFPQGDAAQLGRIVELENEVANLQAALTAAEGDRDAAVVARDVAQTNLATAMEGQAETAALQARAQEAEASAAALQAQVAELQGALASADAADAEQQAAMNGLAEELNASLARIAALEAQLAAATMDAPVEETTDQPTEEPSQAEAAPSEAPEDSEQPTQEDAAEEDVDGAAAAELEEADAGHGDPFDADALLAELAEADLSPIARAALSAAVEQARENPALAPEVLARVERATGG
ncbi:hypothetical protein [Nioella sp.]|uniref:hypothetical protein n=1 Tax=Nioella sp. TaxID=1912091 RepID=UPI003513808A